MFFLDAIDVQGTMGTLPMEPRPLPQSWPSHWHPTIARYNGTLQWHHVHSPKVGRHPPNHSTLQWHPTMVPSNGTTSTAPCNGTVPRPIRQSGSSPSPPIGSKNPYSYHYLGNKKIKRLDRKRRGKKSL